MWVEWHPGDTLTVETIVSWNPDTGKVYVWRQDVVCSGRERLGE